MVKQSLFGISVSLLILAGAFGLHMAQATAAGKGGDEVFLDEGDGDFDPLPAGARASKPSPGRVEEKPSVAEAPAVKNVSPKEEMPKTETAKEVVSKTESPGPERVVEQSLPERAPKAKSAKKEKLARNEPKMKPAVQKQASKSEITKTRKPASLEKAAQGSYVVTREPCPMKREPASEGASMLTVKAGKRVWIEEVDAEWVRAFNKAGEPGYLNRNCLK